MRHIYYYENIQAIGRQSIPPYFGLGFQLCRWGYDTIETMQATVNRTAAAGIPQVGFIIIIVIIMSLNSLNGVANSI